MHTNPEQDLLRALLVVGYHTDVTVRVRSAAVVVIVVPRVMPNLPPQTLAEAAQSRAGIRCQ